MKRLVTAAGGGLAAAGLAGVVSYLIARVSGPHLPLWPYGVFAAMMGTGGLLYVAAQRSRPSAAARWLVPRPPEGFVERLAGSPLR